MKKENDIQKNTCIAVTLLSIFSYVINALKQKTNRAALNNTPLKKTGLPCWLRAKVCDSFSLALSNESLRMYRFFMSPPQM